MYTSQHITTQIHIAAQYLAAAQISFLEKKDDDSHTNLRFNSKKGYLETWPLNKSGCIIALDYQKFALYWLNKNNSRLSIYLDGKTHQEIIDWMKKVTEAMGIQKTFEYNLHYELPYEVTKKYRFAITDTDTKVLEQLVENRTLANTVLETVIKTSQLASDVRIWPHHFDTGAFSYIEGTPRISIGLGLAIPDTISDEYYFYISAYNGHDSIDTTGFTSLTIGEWRNNGFKGAILPISTIDKNQGVTFFKEAINAYIAN